MKYAVIESGGKQYIAREGETIEVDRLPIEVGKSITIKEILLIVDNGKTKVGNPYVKGVTIKGTVVAEVKAPKIIVYKYIPRERYRKKQGHRQRYSRVLIDSIAVRSTSKTTEKEEPKKETKPAPKETTAAKPKPAAKKKPAAKPAAKKTATKSTATSTKKTTASKSSAKKSTAKKSTTTKSKTSAAKPKSSSKKTAAKKSSTKSTTTKKSSTSKK
jgi:large subunit ribosomal protein L21